MTEAFAVKASFFMQGLAFCAIIGWYKEVLMKISLSDGSLVQVSISKKTMKNIRLRVCRDGRVCVSAPYGTAESRIYEFVNSKKGWIESHIRNFQKAENTNTVQFLGSEYSFEVVKDRRTGVALNGNSITVFCTDPEKHKEVVESWWKQQAAETFAGYVDKWYPLVCGDDGRKPVVKVRKMQTLWGSCTSKERTIRLNYYLMCASAECIEYVVLHELIHLVHPNHGPEFRAFLVEHMPDWKERKTKLEQECSGLRMV